MHFSTEQSSFVLSRRHDWRLIVALFKGTSGELGCIKHSLGLRLGGWSVPSAAQGALLMACEREKMQAVCPIEALKPPRKDTR